MPKISVIVPVYKVEKYIHRCVDSILNQTFRDFELILVDDGSPDNCGAICDEYAQKDGRVVVIHQENGGLSAARNVGIDWAFANSESQWLAFVDSDDWVHPQFLELLYTSAEKLHTKIATYIVKKVDCYSGFKRIDNPALLAKKPEEVYIYQEGCCGGPFACAYLYCKDLFAEIRYPMGKVWEDRATTYKLLFRTSEVSVVEEELYFYFYNPDGISKKKWSVQNLDVIEAWEGNLDFFSNTSYIHLMKYTVESYFTTIACQYGELQKSDLPQKLKKKHGYRLRRKLIAAFWKYRKMQTFRYSRDSWMLWVVFPRLSWLYWAMAMVFRKLGIRK